MVHVVRLVGDLAKIPERYGAYRTVSRPLQGLSTNGKKMADAVASMLCTVGFPCVVTVEEGEHGG